VITGRFGNTSGRPYVEGRFLLPDQAIAGNISFLVDTGADLTTIMPSDGQRLGIDYTKFTNVFSTTGIDGDAPSYRAPVVLAFLEQNRKKLCFYSVRVALFDPEIQPAPLPSLLGRDILNHWRMVCDNSKRRLTFTVRFADLSESV